MERFGVSRRFRRTIRCANPLSGPITPPDNLCTDEITRDLSMDFARRMVPAAIRRRYAVKFGIALLILGLSVGLIGYAATAGITDQMEDRVEADHASAVEQDAQSLQMWNTQNEHTVEMIASSNVVASDDPAAIEQQFLDWEEHLGNDTVAISSVDLNAGTVTASTTDAFRGASTADLENIPESAYANATQTAPWV